MATQLESLSVRREMQRQQAPHASYLLSVLRGSSGFRRCGLMHGGDLYRAVVPLDGLGPSLLVLLAFPLFLLLLFLKHTGQ